MTASQPKNTPVYFSRANVMRMLIQSWLGWRAITLLPLYFYLAFCLIIEPPPMKSGLAGYVMLPVPVCAIALGVSIVAPSSWFQRPSLGWLFILALLLGICIVVWIYQISSPKKNTGSFEHHHIFLGPVIVAIWNIARIIRVRWILTSSVILLVIFPAGNIGSAEPHAKLRAQIIALSKLSPLSTTPVSVMLDPRTVFIADNATISNTSLVQLYHLQHIDAIRPVYGRFGHRFPGPLLDVLQGRNTEFEALLPTLENQPYLVVIDIVNYQAPVALPDGLTQRGVVEMHAWLVGRQSHQVLCQVKASATNSKSIANKNPLNSIRLQHFLPQELAENAEASLFEELIKATSGSFLQTGTP